MAEIRQPGLFLAIIFLALFITTNVNPFLGQVYTMMMLASGFFILIDWARNIPIQRSSAGQGKSLLWAVAIYGGFLFASVLLIPLFKLGLDVLNINSVIGLFSTTTPLFAESQVFTFINFLVAAVVETVTLIVVLDVLMTKFRIPFSLRSPAYWVTIGFLAAAFTIFHLTAKGIPTEQNTALFVTFIFAMVTLVMLPFFKQSREAIYFHMIANGLAVASLFGLIL